MIDLMAEGYRLWGLESKTDTRPLAEVAEVAENAQPRAFPLADELRTTCGFPQSAVNPQPIRSKSAAANPRGYGKSAQSAESAAPAHEIERIIAALVNEVSRDLGPELIDLMRRAMRLMDRETRANLTAEIDDAFEQAVSVKEAREQASLAIRSRVGNHEPSNADEWLAWIDERCPLLPEDRAHVASGLFRLHTRWQGRLAEQYAEAWHTAADDEPKHHKRDNAGRRAANLIITRLKAGNEYV